MRNSTHHAYFHIKSCFRHIVDSARDHAIDEKWRFLLKKEGETDDEVWKLYDEGMKIEKDYWDDIDKNDREFNELKRRQRELEEMERMTRGMFGFGARGGFGGFMERPERVI